MLNARHSQVARITTLLYHHQRKHLLRQRPVRCGVEQHISVHRILFRKLNADDVRQRARANRRGVSSVRLDWRLAVASACIGASLALIASIIQTFTWAHMPAPMDGFPVFYVTSILSAAGLVVGFSAAAVIVVMSGRPRYAFGCESCGGSWMRRSPWPNRRGHARCPAGGRFAFRVDD